MLKQLKKLKEKASTIFGISYPSDSIDRIIDILTAVVERQNNIIKDLEALAKYVTKEAEQKNMSDQPESGGALFLGDAHYLQRNVLFGDLKMDVLFRPIGALSNSMPFCKIGTTIAKLDRHPDAEYSFSTDEMVTELVPIKGAHYNLLQDNPLRDTVRRVHVLTTKNSDLILQGNDEVAIAIDKILGIIPYMNIAIMQPDMISKDLDIINQSIHKAAEDTNLSQTTKDELYALQLEFINIKECLLPKVKH